MATAAESIVLAPFTVWSDRDRQLLVCLLGYLCLASSLTASIYFPLLELLAEQYGVSIQAINFTITLFMIFQGFAPSFWSPLSDSWGRRPVYLATFMVYTLASLGLSLVERNYAALLVLRALQSVGGSSGLSLAYSVVADVSVHADRGRFLAPMLTASNVGPCIGPIIGGGAAMATGDPRWCFRTLLIFGGSAVLLVGWIMPETNRTIVGNGIVPAKGIWRTWWSIISQGRKQRDALASTTTTPVFAVEYGFEELPVGACFLPGGVGIIAGGFIAGRLMDWNYRVVAAKERLAIDRIHGDDMDRFPIEKARSRGFILILLLSAGVVIGYGWVIEFHVHPAIVLLFQAYLGCKCTIVLQTFSALIVDIFQEATGTAAAANNITRCTLAAAAVAILDPLESAIGRGWVFTLLGLFDASICIGAVLALRRWGPSWREKRRLKRART
ncbi:major facilitator superfamily transporter [Thozetella sp. PMI_491]|nr:major facilitator superfamily transporter [Thozetella sp. PMI_491]